jgi:hypothetical protein
MKSIVTEVSGGLVNLFRVLAQRSQRHATHLPDQYRPERHYMRGPGPKCREIKATLTASSFTTAE